MALACLLAAVSVGGEARAGGHCPDGPSPSWTGIERAAWQSLALGKAFDAEQYAGEAPAGRLIGARFVTELLTCEALSKALSGIGVALRNVVIGEGLELGLSDVPVRFACERCDIGKLDATRSRWRNAVVLNGSAVRDGIDLRFARFDSELRAAGLYAASDVVLDQASVSGNMDFSNFRSEAALSMRDGSVGQKLRLDGARLASLNLGGSRIGDQLIMSGIRVSERAVLDRMKIGGDLLIRTYANGPKPIIGAGYAIDDVKRLIADQVFVLVLNNTDIGGRIEFAHAHINGPMSLDAIRVAEDVWLRGCSLVAGPVQMPFAKIGQNFDLSTTILSSVNATGSQIGGELRLGARGNAELTPPVWSEGAKFTLRNVSVSAWVDAADSSMPRNATCLPVPRAPDPWPGKVDVIGFAYDRAGGLGGGLESERPDAWYEEWLERQEPFSLDPYRRLAGFLRINGREAAADSVLYAGKNRQLQTTDGLAKVFLFLQKVFVGYGIHTWYIFFWATGIIVLGGFVFSECDEAKAARIPVAFAYSADMFLPFIQLRRLHGDIDISGKLRYYLYLHKFMGWFCTTFFVSALFGLFEV